MVNIVINNEPVLTKIGNYTLCIWPDFSWRIRNTINSNIVSEGYPKSISSSQRSINRAFYYLSEGKIILMSKQGECQ